MNELKIFENPEFGSIRTIQIDGEPWLVGKDVAAALGYGEGKSLANAVANHVDGEDKGVTELMTPGGKQKIVIINESGLYSLVLSSKLPGAKKFRKWVTSEVLPSIRKRGLYATPDVIDKMITSPEFGIKLLTALKEEQGKNKVLEVANSTLTVENQIMAPKADYFDELVERNTLTNFREAAKELSVPPKKFVDALIEHKYIYRDKKGKIQPYQQHAEAGLFVMKECYNEKTQWGGSQTLITPKGRETFRLLHLGG